MAARRGEGGGMATEPFEIPAAVLLDAAPDATVIVDEQGIVRAANHLVGALFGRELSDIIGGSVDVLVPSELRGAHGGQRAGYVAAPSQRPMGARNGRRLVAERADGSRFPVTISLSPLRLDHGLYVVAPIRDMSDWIEAERELAAARRRRTLAEEHERIARDLHDTVIQELFAIGMSLQAVHAEAQPERVAARIERAVDSLDETIRQIRSTIFELNAGAQAGTISRDLRQLVESLALSLGFEPAITLIGPLDHALPPAVAAHVLPTVREGLTNIARHARASRAEVLVQLDRDALRVEVRDDGVGIPEDPERSSGLGNLARRAAELGGSLQVRRNGPAGTVLEWTVPVALDDYS